MPLVTGLSVRDLFQPRRAFVVNPRLFHEKGRVTQPWWTWLTSSCDMLMCAASVASPGLASAEFGTHVHFSEAFAKCMSWDSAFSIKIIETNTDCNDMHIIERHCLSMLQVRTSWQTLECPTSCVVVFLRAFKPFQTYHYILWFLMQKSVYTIKVRSA